MFYAAEAVVGFCEEYFAVNIHTAASVFALVHNCNCAARTPLHLMAQVTVPLVP